jgi:hypothetical protein
MEIRWLPWLIRSGAASAMSGSSGTRHPADADRRVRIVRDTQRVLQCQVLRCQEQATRNFAIDEVEWGLTETMVCESHAAALNGGERYVYNSAENVIYMGQDAPIEDT